MIENSLSGKKFNAIYADGSFDQIELGKLINKGGAAGRIFENKNNPKTVAKIFHDRSKSATNRKKLEAMLHNIPNLPTKVKNGVEYIQIAWPTAVLEDEKGFCVGYLMPKVDTSLAVSLDHFMQKAVRQKLKLSEEYSYRFLAAYNLTLMVAAMHECGHYIVDLKPSNVFVYKKTMTVVMFDCDGFSILGEHERYPAEYVSEEYIYPEGENLGCEDMGEEQDKFALAVMIFKLLNNGIHPFSGIPKENEDMLSVQERIFQHHYAYGYWPDLYQKPHPYSIHDFFEKSTLDMFERAFAKNKKRPTAKEWLEHLAHLKLKKCKKNPNHAYFTSKGCGLCISEEKFNNQIETLKSKKSLPKKVREVDVAKIDIKKIEKQKADEKRELLILKRIALAGCILYFVFFSFFYHIMTFFKKEVMSLGYGLQLLLVIFIAISINKAITATEKRIKFNDIYGVGIMMQIFAIACMLISIVLINDFPKEFWSLN